MGKMFMKADSTTDIKRAKHVRKAKKKKSKHKLKHNQRSEGSPFTCESSTEVDNEDSMLDLNEELLPISGYIQDRARMCNEMFRTLGSTRIRAMLPPILKKLDLSTVKDLLADKLELMSQKRILKVLEGVSPEDISSSDSDEDGPELSDSDGKREFEDLSDVSSSESNNSKEDSTQPSELAILPEPKLTILPETELEILELEMRRRAIKAMLSADKQKKTEKSAGEAVTVEDGKSPEKLVVSIYDEDGTINKQQNPSPWESCDSDGGTCESSSHVMAEAKEGQREMEENIANEKSQNDGKPNILLKDNETVTTVPDSEMQEAHDCCENKSVTEEDVDSEQNTKAIGDQVDVEKHTAVTREKVDDDENSTAKREMADAGEYSHRESTPEANSDVEIREELTPGKVAVQALIDARSREDRFPESRKTRFHKRRRKSNCATSSSDSDSETRRKVLEHWRNSQLPVDDPRTHADSADDLPTSQDVMEPVVDAQTREERLYERVKQQQSDMKDTTGSVDTSNDQKTEAVVANDSEKGSDEHTDSGNDFYAQLRPETDAKRTSSSTNSSPEYIEPIRSPEEVFLIDSSSPRKRSVSNASSDSSHKRRKCEEELDKRSDTDCTSDSSSIESSQHNVSEPKPETIYSEQLAMINEDLYRIAENRTSAGSHKGSDTELSLHNKNSINVESDTGKDESQQQEVSSSEIFEPAPAVFAGDCSTDVMFASVPSFEHTHLVNSPPNQSKLETHTNEEEDIPLEIKSKENRSDVTVSEAKEHALGTKSKDSLADIDPDKTTVNVSDTLAKPREAVHQSEVEAENIAQPSSAVANSGSGAATVNCTSAFSLAFMPDVTVDLPEVVNQQVVSSPQQSKEEQWSFVPEMEVDEPSLQKLDNSD